jgi:exonuclease III
MQLRILTLNIWGVHYIAKSIHQRIQALVKHLISPEADYDIIGLQEVRNKSIRIYSNEIFLFLE